MDINVIALPKWSRNSLVGTVTRLPQVRPGNRSSSKQMPGQYLISGHGRFLPHTFQIPIFFFHHPAIQRKNSRSMTAMLNEPKNIQKITHPFVSHPPRKIRQPQFYSQFRAIMHTAVYIGTATRDIYSFKIQNIIPLLLRSCDRAS
jgi:hypothetical protein